MNTQMKRYGWRMAGIFSLLLLLLMGDAYLGNRSVARLVTAQERIGRTWEVRMTLRDTQNQFEKSISAGRGFVLLDDATNIETMKDAQATMLQDVDQLDALVADNPSQKKNVVKLRAIIEKETRVIAEAVRRKVELGPKWKDDKSRAFLSRAFSSKNYIHNLVAQLNKMDSEENQLAISRVQQAKTDERQTRFTVFGATILASVALATAFLLMYKMLAGRFRGEMIIRQTNSELELHIAERTESLRNSNEHLLRSNQELEAFSYTVSHDLRAPLRHVVGFADLLDKKSGALLDDSGKRYLTLIKDAGRRAGQLIDDLLAFSRMGRTELGYIPVPMSSSVKAICSELSLDSPAQKIQWKIGTLPDVCGDPAMLRLVWWNLLENAIKYSGKESVSKIGIAAVKTDTDWEFSVKDNGVGFDMAHAENLFGVFQRLHEFMDFEGTGIGLASVRRIVARHGGRTWAESAPGEGATFYFSLPLKRPQQIVESVEAQVYRT